MWPGVALAIALCSGCVRAATYVCVTDNQCVHDGVTGTCETVGYCSFPDSRCTEGNRYGEASGPFAGICVGEEPIADARVDSLDGAPSGRVASGLVVLYTFDEGTGTLAHDTSGVAPALDLTIGAGASWVSGGLQFATGAQGASSATATKVATACIASNEMTMEAWVRSASAANTTAERIIGVAGNNNSSASSLGQENTGYYGQVRTTTSSTKLPSAAGTSRTTLLHLVHTRTPAGARTLYLDAAVGATSTAGGDQSNWSPAPPITAGNALDGGVEWPGQLLLAAIYCRALSASEVAQNFAAGP